MEEGRVLGMSNLQALVITGDGINCERETAQALALAGFTPRIRHLNDLIAEQVTLDQLSSEYRVLAMPGGFSFGDDLTSGKVLALKIQHRLGWNLSTFAQRGGMAIGICNGFQAMVRMGVFGKDVSITHNDHGKFIDSWVKITPQGQRCVWLRGMGTIDIPLRHGEGRLVVNPARRAEILEKMHAQGMTCLKYELDPNGSEEHLAGLCDPTGRILGLMPHPEAFVRWTAHPEWTSQPERAGSPGQGLVIFQNAYQEARNAT